jgi:hypothetical protein
MPRNTQIADILILDLILGLASSHGLPLHVAGHIGAATLQRLDVIDHKAGAAAGGLAGGWAGVCDAGMRASPPGCA